MERFFEGAVAERRRGVGPKHKDNRTEEGESGP
jgi:hypothetical protein